MATCYKRLSFSNDEEYKLIEFVKDHPALWDASHGEYGNSEVRKLYWMSLAAELKKPVFECRRKWRFVRDYYIHKRRRHSESTPQRDGKYYSLQFLNKVKVVSSKKNHNDNDVMEQNNMKNKIICTKPPKIEVDYLDSDELDYEFSDDPTFEKITVERVGNGDQYMAVATTTTTTGRESGLQHQDQDENDDKSEDYFCKEDYTNETRTIEDFVKLQNIEEIDEENEEHLFEPINVSATSEETTKQTDCQTLSSSLHEKAIDLFFESMAAAVKTFPTQYVAEAKCKVFMAVNEIESKVYKNVGN